VTKKSGKENETKGNDGARKTAKRGKVPSHSPAARPVEAELIEPAPAKGSSDFVDKVKSQKESWQARGWEERSSSEIETDSEAELDLDADFKEEAESALNGPSEAGKVSIDLLPRDPLEGLVLKDEMLDEDARSRGLALADPVALYMAEVRKYPLLTREQEQELAISYRETGDKRAAELLVTSNLRFVVKVAAEYSKFGARLIDLIQEGNVGLMHAVREFNPYKGVRLITYAVWWIRGYIQDHLMRQYSMVRIGTTQAQRKLFYRLQKEKELLESMGEEPSVRLLSSRLGVSESDVETMSQRLQGRDVSLQTSVDESGRTTLLDLESSEETPIDERIGQAEMLTLLQEGIDILKDSLNERELELLEDRLLADEPLTLQEIGEKYGVTREAVRQMENRLLSKIRKILKERLGEKGD
jgi:RNA polymerase sigma-32 factor